ncbi:hypothetical protein C8R43DRAFT_1232137 [Mycena crocata]|nr:hypothetical protein C8R43DRAFT_1232137 [Mycena crocata]
MGAKYLCCLPLRLGVLVISFLQFVVSAFATAILIYALILEAQHKTTAKLSTGARIITIITCVLHAFVGLICLTGFIGAMRRKESYIGMFADLLKFSLAVRVTAVLAQLILYFVNKDKDHCVFVAHDDKPTEVCTAPNRVSPVAVIISALIPIILQAYGVYIVAAYEKKLHKENTARHQSFGLHAGQEYVPHGPEYLPVQEEIRHLTLGPEHTYPYDADTSHSFGHEQKQTV